VHADPKPELFPGDCLLYFSAGSFLDWVIAFKTWSKVSHCEVYRGEGTSVASRNGLGVNLYPVRWEGLAWVLRWDANCGGTMDVPRAMRWFFKHAQGQRYDWLGLLVFYLAVKQGAPNKMFCSEFATRFYRAGGFKPFSEETDADRVAPAQFLQSVAFLPAWKAKE
jgi:hypothetical protein